MIISTGARMGQRIITVLFLGIFGLLLVATALTGNLNYLLIILVATVSFLPIYLYTLRSYDVSIEKDYFIISNLFTTVTFDTNRFQKIVPARTVLSLMKNPYFSIIFEGNKRYMFQIRLGFFSDRKIIADTLTSDIKAFILKEQNGK